MKHRLLSVVLALVSFGASAQTFSTILQTDNKPWTAVPKIKSTEYKFVVLPDKKGGDENGVFERAIQEINRLAPDFVINVGDLIGGYYTDVKYCERDWTDILERLKALDAPFFFVGGNHDLTNQLQTEDFRNRFGASYYSFCIDPDLFIILDSEEHDGRDISEAQVAYFKNILDGWNGRHIYVFMHSPLWFPQNHGGYEDIAPMLNGHDYTVFSGHTHQYYYEERNGMDHFIVATAGGDSERRGTLMGEFDHLMLVSARDGRPAIANIPIGTLVPNDIVDKSTMPLVNWMASRKYVTCPYIMLDSGKPAEFAAEFIAKNPFDQPMEFHLSFPENGDFVFAESQIDETIEPNSEKSFRVPIQNPKGLEPGKLTAETGCAYTIKGCRQPVSGTVDILTDHVRRLPKTGKVIIQSKNPYEVNESWDWHGMDDGWFEFQIETTDKNVVIFVKTHDDIQALDKVEIFLESGGKKYSYSYELGEAQLKFPLSKIKNGKFTLNVSFTDNDDPEEADPSVLWWRLPSMPGQFAISRK